MIKIEKKILGTTKFTTKNTLQKKTRPTNEITDQGERMKKENQLAKF